MATIYGYLHSLSSLGSEDLIAPTEIEGLIFDMCASNTVFDDYKGSRLQRRKGWEIKSFNSTKPMMGEDEADLLGGPYPYPFYIFVNKISGNVIIGSLRYSISNVIIEHMNYFLSRNAKRSLQRFSYDIQAIRKAIEDGDEDALFATLIQLDVNDFSSKIESVSVSGDDVLGESFLNRFDSKTFQARQIGLRVSSSFSESCRLQGSGGMQFYTNRLRDLELCLGAVYRSNAVITDC